MSGIPLPKRANEAAHEAVLEIIKSSPLSGHGLAAHRAGDKVADNLIELHKKLAEYYRGLDEE